MNNIDTFVVNVSSCLYNADEFIQKSKFDSIYACINKDDSLNLRVSAKVLKTKDDIGSILNISDIEKLLPIIKEFTGIKISTDALLNSKLTRVDIKKDIHFEDALHDVISSLREIFSSCTTKNEVLTYYNKVGYNNSLLIKSTFKTVKDSLCIYKKLNEMYLKRNNDNGYYYSFSDEFIQSYKNVLRFERKIQWVKALRKALHVSNDEKVTLKHIFDCTFDLLGEKVNSLIGNIKEVA